MTMKFIKSVILIIGILALASGAYNIIVMNYANQWFGFTAGGFMIWLFFRFDRVLKLNSLDL